jgi:hypothetical protein
VELNSELSFELLEFEASKILGEDISSVIFGGDMIQHNLFYRYALTHIMIFDINMFGAYFLHRVRPNENAALIICIDRDRTQSHTKFKEYICVSSSPDGSNQIVPYILPLSRSEQQ